MKLKKNILLAATLTSLTVGANATVLLTDNFNDNPNSGSATFNNNLASTQGGTLATKTYTVIDGGNGNTTQHSNGNELLVAQFNNNSVGRVSLDNNFATQANATNEALVFSFNLMSVAGFTDADNWGAFTVGSTQNPFVNAGGGAAILFRQSGAMQAFNAGTGVFGGGDWNTSDLVTVTLSGTSGGSAFNGNGSKVNYNVGGIDLGTYALAQQTNAYLTFGIAGAATGGDFNAATFKIDNLSVSTIPEPSAALLGGLGMLALLRRRR